MKHKQTCNKGLKTFPYFLQVTVGGVPCVVTSSSQTEVNCRLAPDSGLAVGVAHPVSLRVNNLGSAMVAVRSEFGRRFVVLPVVDGVRPSVGSPTGSTRLLIQGSGFSAGLVTVANAPCSVLSLNYTHIVCDTSPSPPGNGVVRVLVGMTIPSSCSSDCSFLYSSSVTPSVTGVSPSNVTGNFTVVTVSGAGFGSDVGDVVVSAGDVELRVTAVLNTTITLEVGALPAGERPLRVVVRSRGLAAGAASLTSLALAALSPAAGSTLGGTPLLLRGNGFLPGNTTVWVGGAACGIQAVTPDAVVCLTPAHSPGQVTVLVQVLSETYPALSYSYSAAHTPVITSISPSSGEECPLTGAVVTSCVTLLTCSPVPLPASLS